MCATSWKAQVPVWTPAHPSVCDQQQEPDRTLTDPLQLWDGQAVPGEAHRALPGGWQPAHPSPWLYCAPKMSPSQHRQADTANPWESPNALLRYVLLFSPFPSREQRQGIGKNVLPYCWTEGSSLCGQECHGVSFIAPLNQLRPPGLAGRAGIILGCGTAAWWVCEYPGLQPCSGLTSAAGAGS